MGVFSSFRLAAAALALAALPGRVSAAPPAAPVSEIVVDAQSGRTLYAANADRRRSPASLAKIMTLLLAFDALRSGRLKTGGDLVMTAAGERQAPSRLGLARGKTMDVGAAMRAVAVISANDIAVAFADRIGGSEAKFVGLMNRRAAELGMANTRFGNATGLAPSAGYTTAADMAVLARYILQRYPDRYKLFGTRSIRWKRWVRPNHNQLLGKVEGVDGIKTGYTVAAGVNLVASAKRDGKRVIVVVMGSRTGAARDLLVANLLESGFASPLTADPKSPARRLRTPEPERGKAAPRGKSRPAKGSPAPPPKPPKR